GRRRVAGPRPWSLAPRAAPVGAASDDGGDVVGAPALVGEVEELRDHLLGAAARREHGRDLGVSDVFGETVGAQEDDVAELEVGATDVRLALSVAASANRLGEDVVVGRVLVDGLLRRFGEL